MAKLENWRKEPGARVEGSRDLDRSKVQAPCIVRAPEGGYRLFYTGVGPGKPFADCQGYILSAVSSDGLDFEVEPGIRVAPRRDLPQMSLRVLAPSIVALPDGRWRMYFEARGSADRPTAICSAVSRDQLAWDTEDGVRLTAPGGVGAPRFLQLGEGAGRLYCFASEYGKGGLAGGQRLGNPVVSAATTDGVNFVLEPGYRLRDRQDALDGAGITAAEVMPPDAPGGPWTMLYSAWQDLPSGTVAPLHPSLDAAAVASGRSADFAAASIAADMSGYRSRILVAHSDNGLDWVRDGVVIEGDGYGGDDIDAVHAEDMSLIDLGDGRYRMYYAACDAYGVWRIASAISA
ncbi:MAG: hypothetical protein HY834_06570 [Devosia nanyangense]|uniref:Glycosyl hydrolase family 32 N-terminal domain-containing protein n=1 Tax=Devosia nanyangense TaxID=1228055 RepID=A0A933NYF1_9HYPH|nr:hypothetical protein [Devosia nanyangense]